MNVIFIPHTSCTGCGACLNACPISCISMELDEEKFYYPKINESKCTNCKKCEKVCPVANKKTVEKETKAFAVVANDDNIRMNSSSGGAFTLLSQHIILGGGIVFGVALSDDSRHIMQVEATDFNGLDKLRGSKYVQSSTGRSYQKVKEYLDNGKLLFYTGTPCQIQGLKGYLGKDYENLFTADLICHGVPSQYVWNKYLDYREKMEGASVKRTYFRCKDSGWNTFSLLLEYSNGNEYVEDLLQDPYMQAFLNNSNLRPCCYNCNFKSISRISDFTLADLWGIDEICPNWNDDKGVSLILAHTDKALDCIEKIRPYCRILEIETELAIKHNEMAVKSMKMNPKRRKFIQNIDKMDFGELASKYGTPSYTPKQHIGRMLRKMGLR